MNNVTFHKGNIFNSKMQTIVNTINCVGVMGKGIALVFKLRYPSMFDKYKEYCSSKMIELMLFLSPANLYIRGMRAKYQQIIGSLRCLLKGDRYISYFDMSRLCAQLLGEKLS